VLPPLRHVREDRAMRVYHLVYMDRHWLPVPLWVDYHICGVYLVFGMPNGSDLMCEHGYRRTPYTSAHYATHDYCLTYHDGHCASDPAVYGTVHTHCNNNSRNHHNHCSCHCFCYCAVYCTAHYVSTHHPVSWNSFADTNFKSESKCDERDDPNYTSTECHSNHRTVHSVNGQPKSLYLICV
jgi:hypothetical protein